MYEDASGGHDIFRVPRPQGRGYAFSTLSMSQEPDLQDDKPSTNTPSSLNKFDVFSFGPNLSFCCANSNTLFGKGSLAFAYKGELFANQNGAARTIPTNFRHWGDLYWYAFSPHGDQAVAARDMQTGLSSWALHSTFIRQNTDPTYSSLTQWLRTHVPHDHNDLSNSSLVFGTGASYFVKSAAACTWHDLPDRLDEYLRSKGAATFGSDGKVDVASIPRLIALGAEDDFIAVMEGGAHNWSLNRTHFLSQRLREGQDVNTWECLALNPYNARDFFLCKDNGSVYMKYEDIDSVTCTNISGKILRYMQGKAEVEHRTYEVEIRIGEKTANLSITPDTKVGAFALSD